MRARKETERADDINCFPGGLQIEGIFQICMKCVVERINLQEREQQKKKLEHGTSGSSRSLSVMNESLGVGCLVTKMS